jgi:hypothetical protein
MKKYIPVMCLLCFILILISCKKSNDNNIPQLFTWKINNSAEQLADNISFLRLFSLNTISASKGTTSLSVSTSGSNPGVYTTLNANAGIVLTIAGNQYNSISGSVTITSNSNYRLTGKFDAIVVSVDTINLSGTFNNIIYY